MILCYQFINVVMNAMQIKCLNPQLIVHPLASELIAKHGNYTIFGHQFILTRCRHLLYTFNTSFLNPKKLNVTHENFETCFITDFDTGEVFPLYLQICCGHCDICKEAKVNAFVERCKLETQCYNSRPIFLTLTYNEENKPKNGVSVRDCQLFFKRLRINLFRKGYRERIRYVLVAEYGRNTHRAHYHAILWNLRQTDFLPHREIIKTIEESWHNGFILSRFVDPSNDKAFYYSSKYLRKDCIVPEGCNKTFILSSNRGGGIGSPYISKIRAYVVRQLSTDIFFTNRFSGRTEKVTLSRFLLNKLLPSLSTSLPPKLKTYVRTFLLNYSILNSRNQKIYCYEKAKQITDFFGQYFYCPILEPSEIKASMEGTTPTLFRSLVEAEIHIDRAMRKGREYFDRAVELDRKRKLFLEKLFKHVEDIPLKDRAYQIRRRVELSKQLEIL